MANPVSWFEIMGKDGPKLQKFYGDLFEWKIDAGNPMQYGMVEGSDGGIGGGIGRSQDGRNHVTVYVSVDDPQAYLNKAESLGGKTVMGVTEIPDMVTFALFTDPEGNMVGVVKSQPES
jgi:predicted enzyme related to lactoylglutathione lyase